jgi:membrane-bound lytic murein transglycosylase D
MVALAMFVMASVTGCGMLSHRFRGGSGSDLLAADESLVDSNGRGPSQLAPRTARVLPKPEFGVTPEVQAELNRFMTAERQTVIRVLDENSNRYKKTKEVFEGQGVPAELLSVAAVESGFNPQAHSPAGARGMWQFMKSTARIYGLKVAAKHLRDLFNSFNDWHLALAAYNAGSGAVNRVVSAKGERDFWGLSRQGALPRETRNFVPRVIALSLIFKDPSRYGFSEIKAIG